MGQWVLSGLAWTQRPQQLHKLSLKAKMIHSSHSERGTKTTCHWLVPCGPWSAGNKGPGESKKDTYQEMQRFPSYIWTETALETQVMEEWGCSRYLSPPHPSQHREEKQWTNIWEERFGCGKRKMKKSNEGRKEFFCFTPFFLSITINSRCLTLLKYERSDDVYEFGKVVIFIMQSLLYHGDTDWITPHKDKPALLNTASSSWACCKTDLSDILWVRSQPQDSKETSNKSQRHQKIVSTSFLGQIWPCEFACN